MLIDYFRTTNSTQKLIFIVEDNEVYAKALQSFLQTTFPNIKEIIIFNLGEMCLLELHRNPGTVIMDYLLNSDFASAYNGFEVIKRIKASKPETNIVVLSAQEKLDSLVEIIEDYDCKYVQKDKDSFQKVGNLIKEFLSQKRVAVTE